MKWLILELIALAHLMTAELSSRVKVIDSEASVSNFTGPFIYSKDMKDTERWAKVAERWQKIAKTVSVQKL